MRKRVLRYCLVLVAFVIGTVGVSAAQESLIDWAAIFHADGTIGDLGGGIDAIFLQDNVSAGIATDMTALDAAKDVAFNGPVSTAHDLGNAFVYATEDVLGNLVLYAAAERFISNATTYVEFEFNQAVVGVSSGDPWPIQGARTANDIKVRFQYVDGGLAVVKYGTWNGSGYQFQTSASPAPTGCFTDALLQFDYCNGGSVAGLPAANKEVWDSTFRMVEVPAANGFVEVRINLASAAEFSSVTVRTPEDANFGSFQAMGHWAALE